MAITSVTTILAALRDIDIAGVEVKQKTPPVKLEAGDLPAMWGRLLSKEEGPLTVKTYGGHPTFSLKMIVAVEPIMLDTPADNSTKTETMVDNIDAAIRALSVGTIGRAGLEWSSEITNELDVGSSTYWAVIVDITAKG